MAYAAVAQPSFSAPRGSFLGFIKQLITQYQEHQTRRALHELSDRQLLDIGLVRADINDLRFNW
ncbi:MAG: DUF1127 domain-containing protein [Pseudomonadota bacterium]